MAGSFGPLNTDFPAVWLVFTTSQSAVLQTLPEAVQLCIFASVACDAGLGRSFAAATPPHERGGLATRNDTVFAKKDSA
jgi:hypothetical protein